MSRHLPTISLMNDQYLLVLGRNFELSRAEALLFCDEIFASEKEELLLAENLRFENPRNIPRAPEQLFLDRLGGTIRMGKVLGEFFSKEELVQAIFEHTTQETPDEKRCKLGISTFGTGNDFLQSMLGKTRGFFEKNEISLRIENVGTKSLTSGQIFERKILKKGFEFLIWQNGNSFLLASTVANQNLRNYVLRDRAKTFRDAKMGMLPPKLAQILINLADPKTGETVIDPFCGSGTVNAEAAIMGYKTVGSDLSEKNVKGAIENFAFLAEKFRYDPQSGAFFESDAVEFPWDKHAKAIMATEGWLGHNFTHKPTKEEIQRNSQLVIDMWSDVFKNMKKSGPRRIALCIPAWQYERRYISFHEKIFAKISKHGYTPLALFGGKPTFLYAREGAFVAREICVLERN